MLSAKNFRLVSTIRNRSNVIEFALEKSELQVKNGKVTGDRANYESVPYELAMQTHDVIGDIYCVEDARLQGRLMKSIPALRGEEGRLVKLALERSFGPYENQTVAVQKAWDAFLRDRRDSDYAALLEAIAADAENKSKKATKKAKKTNKKSKEETVKEEVKEENK